MKIIKKILLHCVCWLLYYCMADIEGIVIDFSFRGTFAAFTSYFLLACLFYFLIYYLNPKFLFKGKYWEFFISIFVLFFIYNFARIYQLRVFDRIYPAYILDHTYNHTPISFIGILPRSITYYSNNMSLFICYCLWINTKTLNKNIIEKGKLALEQERRFLELKAENVQSELLFLQNQINPHFLYNTLNLFYAKMVPQDQDLADGILTLSDVMRYALNSYTQNSTGQKTLLSDEVAHLQNVIKINHLRFPNNMYLDFEMTGSLEFIYMLPLVLITFVENIFKHGAVHLKEYPAKIRLTVTNGTIQFETFNKKKNSIQESCTGIGLKNIRKRLEYTYGKNFSLNTNDNGNFYTVSLVINNLNY